MISSSFTEFYEVDKDEGCYEFMKILDFISFIKD